MPNKLTQEYVEEKISERGFTLLSDYVSAHVKMDIECPTCGNIFNQTWANFNAMHGCNYCANINNGNKKRKPFDTVKQDFEKRGFVLLSESHEYKGNDTILRCICPCGRECTKRYYDLMAGKKCDACAKERLSELFRTTPEQADEIALAQDLKILKYNYKNEREKILVECLTCECQFKMSLRTMKCGCGCPECKASNGERKLLQYIQSLEYMEYIHEYKFIHDPKNGSSGCRNVRDLPFDLWIKNKYNQEFLIEFDGLQHFESVGVFGGEKSFNTQRKNDIIKSMYCYNNNIPLLRISYLDIDNIDKIVEDFLNQYNCNKLYKSKLHYSNLTDYAELIAAITNSS